MENKYEMLKDTIYQLYSKEGRTKSYISRLLNLNRKTLTQYINDIWKLPKAKPHKYMNPSTEKFLNKNKQYIKSKLDKDTPIKKIAKELGCTVSIINTVVEYDDILKKAKDDYIKRIHLNHLKSIEELKEKSYHTYDFADLDGEEWKEILGYPKYYVSNMGRFKHYSERYNSYFLLTININSITNRQYICIANKKTFSVPRLVAHTFIDGFSEENNTVNHKDGDVSNNKASNLEWVSQSVNNKHAYDELNRKKVCVGVNNRKYKHFVYKGKYEFKTVAAFARFIGKSETQARRWLDEPKKHDIMILKDCND